MSLFNGQGMKRSNFQKTCKADHFAVTNFSFVHLPRNPSALSRELVTWGHSLFYIVTITADLSGINAKCLRLTEIAGTTLAKEVPEEAGRVAIQLAFHSQPFGFEKANVETSAAKITRDYNRVYPNSERLVDVVASYARPKDRLAARERMRRYMASGNSAASEKMFRNMHVDFTYGRNADISFHKDRWQGGKIRSGRGQSVLNKLSVVRLIKVAVDKIGFAKSAWIAAARDLTANLHDVPLWVKRGKGPGSATVTKMNPMSVSVTLRSDVSYASDVLPDERVNKAIAYREEQMALRIKRILNSRFESDTKD